MIRYLALIAVCGIAAANIQLAQAGATLSPMDIFAKHAAAIGYSLSDGRGQPCTMSLKTTWKDKYGEHVATQLEKRAGFYSYNARSKDGIAQTWGFDGHAFWTADSNGNVTTEIGYARPFDVTWNILESEAFDATLNAVTRPQVGTDYVVRLNPGSGVPADVYFNQMTFYIDKVVVDPGRENIEESLSDYQRRGPVVIAMTRKFKDTTTTVTSFQWNAPLREDEFTRPQQRDYIVFPVSGSDAESFNPDFYPGIVIKAKINGVEGRFLVDTGASGVFIGASFARRAKLPTFGQGAAEMVGGFAGLKFARPDSLQIGGLELKNFTVFVPDRDFPVTEFDGLIGYSVLNQTVFGVDFDAKKITFYNPASFTPPAATGYMIIGLDDGTPQVQATINTKLPVFMDLDLGASGISLVFSNSFLKNNPGIVEGGFRGVGAAVGTLAQIDLGPFHFFGLSAGVLTTEQGFGGEKVLQGLIGYETLRRFNLTFDYRSNKMYLTLNNYGNETKFGGGQH